MKQKSSLFLYTSVSAVVVGARSPFIISGNVRCANWPIPYLLIGESDVSPTFPSAIHCLGSPTVRNLLRRHRHCEVRSSELEREMGSDAQHFNEHSKSESEK